MKGEAIVFHLFDVGGTLDLAALDKALAGRGPRRPPSVGKGTPAYVEFPRPLVLDLESVNVEGPNGLVAAKASIHFFPVGAVSVRIRVPLEVESMARLETWGAVRVLIEGKSFAWEQASRLLLERERPVWDACVRERYTTQIIHESYTVFAFHDVGEDAEKYLQRNEREVAGLLKGEDGSRLHEREVKEALKKWFSYYHDDVVVIDWDAALILDPDADYEDTLFVLEITNLQLLEFRAYDDYLDDAVARAYDDLERLFRRPSIFRNARKAVHNLSFIRMEIAELADDVDNITKFLGDWFLARIHQAAQEKFHLADWRSSVDEKLGILNTLYVFANEESDSLRMITLELLIVLLFVLDLAILFFQ